MVALRKSDCLALIFISLPQNKQRGPKTLNHARTSTCLNSRKHPPCQPGTFKASQVFMPAPRQTCAKPRGAPSLRARRTPRLGPVSSHIPPWRLQATCTHSVAPTRGLELFAAAQTGALCLTVSSRLAWHGRGRPLVSWKAISLPPLSVFELDSHPAGSHTHCPNPSMFFGSIPTTETTLLGPRYEDQNDRRQVGHLEFSQ